MTSQDTTETHRVRTIIRPSSHGNKQISFLWEPGQTIAELIYLPGQGLRFAVANKGKISIEEKIGDFEPLEWIGAYATSNGIRLPSQAAPFEGLDAIAARMRAFIHRYFEADAAFESVATLFALHTWIKERFQAVPYLRFMGIAGSGKTRATETIGAICYRPIMLGGNTTPAAVFRMLEGACGTLLLDEGDFDKSQIGSDIAKILNSGYQRNTPITRMEKSPSGGFVPTPFDAFGPKILNGRSPFRDDATESRCLSHTPRSLGRRDVPRQLPDEFEHEALAIRNMALGWRLAHLETFKVRDIHIDALRPRTSQIIMPLLLIAEQLGDGTFSADLLSFARVSEAQALEERKDCVEARLVEAFTRCSHRPTSKDLIDKIMRDLRQHDPSAERWLTPRKVASILKGLGFTSHHTNRGGELLLDPAQLASLCTRFGIVTPASLPSAPEGDGGDYWVTVPEATVTVPTYTM